ncbi:hypothetical protein BHU72_09505 [Desulfuribacillus stibiiarsenatis]|uniref:Galactosyldiacylglycerol synthase n=1 Tax=Desulfuribacillus stibiiarsenatis TaxID=1390249 RepID=A0A1E5L2Y5_9FIRM|nr:glycosyltransferase [Desulfuribacillus stibiiarsenatis]OEH84444.1 hypothetical protein BHU72_09505 [Desulfuribacillus stibiiarsenatis]
MMKRILILSEPFGSGHTMVAKAIRDLIICNKAGWKVDVLELSSLLRPAISQMISFAYLQSLKYSPSLWAKIYKKTQYTPIPAHTQFLLRHLMYARIEAVIKEHQPDVIICTHPFPAMMISKLKKSGLHVMLCTVVTDYCFHSSWVNDGVDVYLLPSDNVFQEFIQFGVSPSKLKVTGIPVQPKFLIKSNKTLVRKKLGLADMPTILCMGGGLGVGFDKELIDMILTTQNIQILFVTGRNNRLYQMIETNGYDKDYVHLFSFVENVDELMDASDLMITKPGGVTCAEALVKKLPTLLLQPLPGQEEGNLLFMNKHQYSMYTPDGGSLNRCLESFSNNPTKFLDYFHIQYNNDNQDNVLEVLGSI